MGRGVVSAGPDLPAPPPQTYEVRGSLQGGSQVTVSLVLENLSSHVLKNLELGVLDSLNARLARLPGASAHDGVPVPFQLPPGEALLNWAVRTLRVGQGAGSRAPR